MENDNLGKRLLRGWIKLACGAKALTLQIEIATRSLLAFTVCLNLDSIKSPIYVYLFTRLYGKINKIIKITKMNIVHFLLLDHIFIFLQINR